jgi:hypothetical protein
MKVEAVPASEDDSKVIRVNLKNSPKPHRAKDLPADFHGRKQYDLHDMGAQLAESGFLASPKDRFRKNVPIANIPVKTTADEKASECEEANRGLTFY